MKALRGYDIAGNIAIVKFDRAISKKKKKKISDKLLKEHKNVKTILEKTSRFKGRLRTLKTKWIAGEKTKEALYKENNCIFRFNVDSCYFSPRLASERAEIAKKVKKGESVLVMFSGIGVYGIVIAKLSKAKKVISIELSRECNRYALENVKRNKLENRVEIIQGDVRKALPKIKEKFSRIVMPRPNLEDSFLDAAFPKIKKNGIIHYYGFYEEDKVNELKSLIIKEAEKARKRIKILRIKKAGDIGMRKFRYRADVKVMN